jgi:hypothetical protein
MNLLKTAAAGGALAAALASGQAFAVTDTFDNWLAASTGITSESDPDDFGGLTETDKTISLVGFGSGITTQATNQQPGLTISSNTDFNEAASELRVSFNEDTVNDRHQVNILPDDGGVFDFTNLIAGDVLAVQYVINIDPSDFPPLPDQERFGTVRLSLNAQGDFTGLTVTKRVQGLTPATGAFGEILWATNNNFAIGEQFDSGDALQTTSSTAATIFCGVCTTFLVTDFIELDTAQGVGTSLSQVSNGFDQVVPVPAPLALLGAGLIGIGVARRVAKKNA